MATLAGYKGAFYAARRNCLQFDAANETLTVSDPSGGELDFGATSSFSVEVWVNVAATGDGLILQKLASDTGYQLEVASDKLVFTVGDGTFTPSITGDTSVNDAGWHHVLCVRDVSNDKLYLYLDGASDATGVDDTTTGTLANAANLIVGNTDEGNLRRVAQVRVYNSAISAANAAKLAAGDWPQLDTYVVGSWACINGSGSTVLDDSGKKNNGTIANATWSTTTYASETAEVPTGAINGTNKTYTLAYSNVDDENITITVDGSALAHGDYTLTPGGTIVCATAPAASITVNYRHHPLTLECGEFYGWSITYTADILDTTTFGNAARTYIGNLTRWEASTDRYVIHGGHAHDLGSKLLVKLYWDEANAKRFEGWAYVAGVARDVTPEAIVHDAITFTGREAPAIESS